MRSILSALGKSLPIILNGFMFAFLIFVLVSVLGMNLFYGQFETCSCNPTQALSLRTQEECTSVAGLVWEQGKLCCMLCVCV